MAGVEQTKGLITYGDGSLKLDMEKRKELADKSRVDQSNAIYRYKGGKKELEYKHEAELFELYKDKFDHFNELLRSKVKNAVTHENSAGGSCNEKTIGHRHFQLTPIERGVTLGQLRKFDRELCISVVVKRVPVGWGGCIERDACTYLANAIR